MISPLLFAAVAAEALFNIPVKDKPVAQIEAGQSYLLVRASGASGAFATPIAFFREPGAEEIADYHERKSEAFAKAHAKWVKADARWKEEYKTWQAAGSDIRGRSPERPIEPTMGSFDFPTIEQENMLVVGPFNRFAKDKTNDLSVYVSKVRPGRYHFYGPVFLGVDGSAFGTCACMGSISFEVSVGEITDAGTMRLNLQEAWSAASKNKSARPKDEFDLPEGVTQVGWSPASGQTPVDPRLAGFSIKRAALRPSGPFPNWYKVQVDRLTAVPGILAYNRDRIIDVAAGGSDR